MRAAPLVSCALIAAAALLCWTSVARADIVFGQSCALSGPTADLGTELSLGLRVAFDEINAQGGVRGHNLTLITMDDRYEPAYAINNTRTLVNDLDVFAMLGSVGTPTSQVAMPIAVAAGTPFVGAFTGAQLLRDPFNPLLINVRASYYDETAAMVDYLINRRLFTRVSLFVQNDSFGQTGYDGAKRALAAMGLAIESEGRYERNTLNVEKGLADVTAPGRRPQAIIMIGTYAPLAKFVRLAKASPSLERARDVVFLTVSFVGSSSFRDALGNETANVIITEVVPSPADMSNGLVRSFTSALATTAPSATPSHVSLEGYLTGRFVASALERISPRVSITRASFLETVYRASSFIVEDVSMGPFRNLTAVCPARICRCNQGMKDVWAVRINATTREFEYVDEARFTFYDTCFSNVADLKYPIVLAQTAPFSGSGQLQAAVAAGFRKGVEDAFAYTNVASGGVFGHRLHLLSADDGGNPVTATRNVQRFTSDAVLFGMVGPVGSTGTRNVGLALAAVGSAAGVFGPQDASIAPRDTFVRHSVYTTPSHKDEARAVIDFALSNLRATSVSIVYAALEDTDALAMADADSYAVRMVSVQEACTAALGTYGLLPKRTGSFSSSWGIPNAVDMVLFRDGAAGAFFVAAEGSDFVQVVSLIRARVPGVPILACSHVKETLLSLVGSPGMAALLDGLYVADGLAVRAPSAAFATGYALPPTGLGVYDAAAAQAHGEGWLVGRLVSDALVRSYVGQPTAPGLLAALFAGFTFNVDGVNLGPLSDGPCGSASGTCQCNQAARQVYVYRMHVNGSLQLPPGYRPFTYSTCGVDNSAYVSPYDSLCDYVTADSFTFADDYSAALFVNKDGVRFQVAMSILIVLAASAAALYTVTRPRVDFLQGRPSVAVIRRSLSNYLNTLSIVIEAFQLITMVFAADLGWSALIKIRKAFDSIGLQYEFSWHYYAMLPLSLLWVVYAFIVWTGASQQLRQLKFGGILLFPVRHLLPLMGTIGYIPAVMTMLESFACVYTSSAHAVMDFSCETACWTPHHWTIASFGVVAMLLFVPMAVMTAFFWQELQHDLDVRFRPRFFVVDYLTKLIMCILRVFFYRFTSAYLASILALNVLLCAIVLLRHPSCVPWINDVKAWAYAMTVWTAVIGLASHEAGGGSSWPQATVFTGWVLLIVVTVVAILKRHKQLFVRVDNDGGRDRLKKITWLFASFRRSKVDPRAGSPSLSKRSDGSGHITPVDGEVSDDAWALLIATSRKWHKEGRLSDWESNVVERAAEGRDPILAECYVRAHGSPSTLLTCLRMTLLSLIGDESPLRPPVAVSWAGGLDVAGQVVAVSVEKGLGHTHSLAAIEEDTVGTIVVSSNAETKDEIDVVLPCAPMHEDSDVCDAP